MVTDRFFEKSERHAGTASDVEYGIAGFEREIPDRLVAQRQRPQCRCVVAGRVLAVVGERALGGVRDDFRAPCSACLRSFSENRL